MSLLALIGLGLAMGVVFGIALEKSRIFEPGMMIGQFQLRNFIMLKVFLTACATGLVVLAGLTAFGLAELHPKATIVGTTLFGGIVSGIGIAVAGACPGTALAQIGAGYRDAVAVVIGGIFGAMAFGYSDDLIKGALTVGDYGKFTLADVSGLPFWILALIAAAAMAGILLALEAWRPWTGELGSDLDGVDIDGDRRESSRPTGAGAQPAE